MNPGYLETLKTMLSIITSDKEAITKQMRADATKIVLNLMNPILKDSEEIFKESSSLVL